MSNHTITWTLNFISNSVTKGLEKISSATNFLTERMYWEIVLKEFKP